MKIRVIKSGPGCVFDEGQIIRMPDAKALRLIEMGFAAPSSGDYWRPVKGEIEKPKEMPQMMPVRNIDREGNVTS